MPVPVLESVFSRIAYHAVYDASIREALEFARDNGFAGVQAALETPHLAMEHVSKEERARICALCAKAGLTLALHAPDDVASLFVSDPHLREGIFGHYGAMLDFARDTGARILTLHPGAMIRFKTDTAPVVALPDVDRQLYRSTFEANLKRLAAMAAGTGVAVCVENYPFDPFACEILQPFLDAGALRLCWDIAKTCRDGGQPNAEEEAFYWGNLAHIHQVHLHDVRDGRGHCVIGTGAIDFRRFLPRLAAAGVAQFCIEVRPQEKALESLQALRRL